MSVIQILRVFLEEDEKRPREIVDAVTGKVLATCAKADVTRTFELTPSLHNRSVIVRVKETH